MSNREPWKNLPAEYREVSSWDGPGYSIDAHIAAEATCGNCGKRGLQWQGMVRDKPYSYKAWIVCPMCGDHHEL